MLNRNYKVFEFYESLEAVPQGYNLFALILQIFWAIVNGTLFKYVLLALPLPILGFINEFYPNTGAYLTLLYLVAAYFIYYPAVANKWREKALLSKGYSLIYQTTASSANEALIIYANQSNA
ncbi:MAG: hypothetical protein R8G33_02520 [Gammaproteobacteria bacterium]|nr:hypothetical protein [Gammaproteobacteria bacterium]